MNTYTQPIEDPETVDRLEAKLNEGNNLFTCSDCSHKVGDPRKFNFLSSCPNCLKIVRFYRIIE